EPVPEFYGRLAKLVDDTRDVLEEADALRSDKTQLMKELADDLRVAIALVQKAREKKADLGSFTLDERNLLSRFDPRLDDVWNLPEKERKSAETLASLEVLLEMGLGLATSGRPEASGDIAFLAWSLGGPGAHWDHLSKICHRLEVLAHKQLRQVPFSEE